MKRSATADYGGQAYRCRTSSHESYRLLPLNSNRDASSQMKRHLKCLYGGLMFSSNRALVSVGQTHDDAALIGADARRLHEPTRRRREASLHYLAEYRPSAIGQ